MKVKVKSLSLVRLFVTLWTVAHQAPLSMGFSSQEYWSGLPFPPPGDLPDPGIKAVSLASLALPLETTVPLPGYKEPSVSSVAQAESWCTVNPLLPVYKNFLRVT